MIVSLAALLNSPFFASFLIFATFCFCCLLQLVKCWLQNINSPQLSFENVKCKKSNQNGSILITTELSSLLEIVVVRFLHFFSQKMLASTNRCIASSYSFMKPYVSWCICLNLQYYWMNLSFGKIILNWPYQHSHKHNIHEHIHT